MKDDPTVLRLERSFDPDAFDHPSVKESEGGPSLFAERLAEIDEHRKKTRLKPRHALTLMLRIDELHWRDHAECLWCGNVRPRHLKCPWNQILYHGGIDWQGEASTT